jgi:ankyrin repeat protein
VDENLWSNKKIACLIFRCSIGAILGRKEILCLAVVMETLRFLAGPLVTLAFAGVVSAQVPAAKVDFAKDIAPLLRQNCVSCHGPLKQNAGLRLDRRSSSMKSRRIIGGNSANSFIFQRVSGSEYGAQMPPTGELHPDQIAMLKDWIDQGAAWPDEMANEVELPPLNQDAIALVEKLRLGDEKAILKAGPALLNARGPEGSTPFMYAVLYSKPGVLARLLKMGADPNKANDANATALMWGARDLEKTRLLVEHGAKVNVVSDDFRTPLMIAARRPGGAAVVKYLLEHGANPNPNARPEVASSPLMEAATAGDAESFALLIEHGAKATGDAQVVLSMAVLKKCDRCVDLVAAQITDKNVYTGSLQDTAVMGDVKSLRMMLDRGADTKALDPFGRTALMYAAASDSLPVEAVKLLVEHGADVNAVNKHTKAGDAGLTVLDIAKRHGDTPVLAYLVAKGAKESGATPVVLNAKFKGDIRDAVQATLPLLQRADANFATSTGCVSCHNNSLTAMTVGMARRQGLRVDEKTAAAQVHVNVDQLAKTRDVMHQGFLVPVGDYFSENVMAYMLLGLNEEGYKADLNTDAAAMLILGRQGTNGEWAYPPVDTRQPLCLDYIGNTALSMRALQLYAPKTDAATYRKSIATAAGWLANAKSANNDDYSWRLAGLAWAGTNKAATTKAMQELLATQKADGGWSDLPSMESTAYATGKSLVALHTAGMAATDPAYERGVKWLLSHQEEDGSWFVQTRAMAFQPAFESGFPHGHNQWISAAGTNWAAMALTYGLPKGSSELASR